MWKTFAAGLVATLVTALPAQAADKLTVMLDWFINPDHAPILAAQSIGAFKEQDLDVEITPPADPTLPPRLVAAKQADIAVYYQPQLYLLADQDLPVVRVGTLISSPLNTVLALSGGSIASIGDLKGKKIGFSVGGLEEATLAAMLKSGGATLSDVTTINVNFQLVSALMSKQVDAVIGGFRNFEANELAEHGAKPVIFKVEDYGVPAYDELIFLTHRDNIGDPRIKRFLAAVQKGVAYVQAHPDESWATFAKDHADLDNPLNKLAWAQTVPLFAKDPAALDAARYAAYGKFLFDAKIIKKELPVASYAVDVTKP